MTLTELRYIVALARERHFGRAAEACFVSQPTLSVAVRKLEEELGVALFERGAGEVAVTPIGERIVQQAQRTLLEAESLKEMARQGMDPLRGPLRLGAIFTIGPYVLPQLVRTLRKAAPQMPLMIRENYTAQLAEQLQQGELDVVLCALPFDAPGIDTLSLYDEPFMVAVHRSHPWTRRKAVHGTELMHERLLLLGTGHCFRTQVLQSFPALDRTALAPGLEQRAMEGSSLETLRLMVASGTGITILPSTAVAPHRRSDADVVYLPFADVPPDRRVILAWRRRFARLPAIRVLAASIRECKLAGIRKASLPSGLPGGEAAPGDNA